nr:dihydrofolate reductase family protein [Dietzia sp. E1]
MIYTAFVSLDGVVEAPGGEPGYRNTGWTFAVEFLEEVYGLKAREQDEAGSMLLGRVSYQAFSAVWPQMVDEFPKYNAIPKYVVSTTLAEGDLVDGWGTTTILRDLDEVAALKQAEGAPILVQGSATLARSLSDAGLIDRYHLLVFPWILGAGKRMWSDTDKPRQKLELVESEAYGNGVQKLIYDVVGFDPEV